MKAIVNKGGNPIRRAALSFTQTLRDKFNWSGALPDDSGHVAYQIPEMDFWFHCRRPGDPEGHGYDLMCPDSDIARKEFLRLIKDHPEYKVNRHEGRRRAVDRIIVR